jgi:phage-related protein
VQKGREKVVANNLGAKLEVKVVFSRFLDGRDHNTAGKHKTDSQRGYCSKWGVATHALLISTCSFRSSLRNTWMSLHS